MSVVTNPTDVHDDLVFAWVSLQQPYEHRYLSYREPGKLVGKSAGLVIEMLRVRIPAGAAGKFSSSESTLCADSYSVSVPPLCYRSGT